MPSNQLIPEIVPPHHTIILASTSPRRQEFLKTLGLPFTVVPPGSTLNSQEIDETPLPGELPAQLVQRLSQAKAQAVINKLTLALGEQEIQHHIIIAADTVVVLEDKILGKPDDPAAAVQMLKQLRRRSHYVYSGITVAQPSNPKSQRPDQRNHFITRLHQSQVWMRPYTDAEISAYVDTGSPLDKAGAYGIQDRPFSPVDRLDGCFASVMGLPLADLAVALVEMDISLPEIGSVCSLHTSSACCQMSIATHPDAVAR